MPYYESEHLFSALSDARERSAGAAAELREGVEELLLLVLLSGGALPQRLESLVDITVDCSPDVRPVVNSTLASLLARPFDDQRRIVAFAAQLLQPATGEENPFKDVFKL